MKNLVTMFLYLSILVACGQDDKQDGVINNPFITVAYDAASKNLGVTFESNEKVFLKSQLLDGATETYSEEETNDPTFGKGNSLVIDIKDGGNITFTLYPSQPFLFIERSVKNGTAEILDIDKFVPISFNVDLGKPTNTLKTLGTGGLLDPDENPGSYVFLTTVDPKTRNGVVTGWLTGEKGSGVLFSDIKLDMVEIKAQIDYGHFQILPGQKEALETLVIGYFDDARLGQEQFADMMAKQNHIVLRERSAVYCTWYDEKHGGAGSEASSIELAEYIKSNLKPFGLGVIQIDDQWQDGGSYNGPSRGFDRTRKVPLEGAVINGNDGAKSGFPANYPNGMETTARAIKANGLIAGIWWMPFARNHQDPEYKDRQHWFAYRKNGEPFETPWGGTSLDLTHPEVQEHVGGIARTLHDWGFDYFKMDGLWTGTVTEQVYINDGYKNDSIGNCRPLYDPSITQIEAFRNGLRTIRKVTNNEVFLSGCAISQNMRSFGASIGLVDAMRIGPDFNHDGESFRTGAIRASRLYFLNGRVWWNDPDPSMLRESGQSSADPAAKGIGPLNRARILPSFVAVSGQFFLSSDWLPDLPDDRLEIMKRCMASHNGTARPVDAFDRSLPSIWLATDDRTGTPKNVIGLFNWYGKSKNIGSTLDWAGLDGSKDYYAFDFWKNKPLPLVSGSFSSVLPAESCQIIALRERSHHPVVVSTSRHVTQGMVDLVQEEWTNGTLSGTSKIVGNDPYELRIAGLEDGGRWKLDKAVLTGDTDKASIEIVPQAEKGWARILIRSKEDVDVDWQLQFSRE